MRDKLFAKTAFFTILTATLALTGCQPPTANTANANSSNAGGNTANSANTNSNSANANIGGPVSSVPVETKEPEQYQAKVTIKFEATGTNQTSQLPALSANVARSSTDRVMEFVLPTNEKIVFLDKAGTNYLILPNRKQYAVLDKDSLGFDVRRMMMPEQIVNQAKAMPGVQKIGEENVNGRPAVKYSYNATTNTQTQAGQVSTDSFILIDKETGLPLHTETVAQSQTGANVQGYKGLRLVTDMSDIKTTPDAAMFNLPTDFQKIESEQVRSQVDLLFNAVTLIIKQALQQAQQPNANPAPANSSANAPAAPPAPAN